MYSVQGLRIDKHTWVPIAITSQICKRSASPFHFPIFTMPKAMKAMKAPKSPKKAAAAPAPAMKAMKVKKDFFYHIILRCESQSENKDDPRVLLFVRNKKSYRSTLARWF